MFFLSDFRNYANAIFMPFLPIKKASTDRLAFFYNVTKVYLVVSFA
jgi:hypothetical protein